MKTYKIEIERKGRLSVYEGTINHLIKNLFGYILEVGVSWDRKINKNPKTIKSLVFNLQKSYTAKEACCYERTSVRLIDEGI